MQALKTELELGIHGDADDLPRVFFVLLSAYALGDFGSSCAGWSAFKECHVMLRPLGVNDLMLCWSGTKTKTRQGCFVLAGGKFPRELT